MDKIVLSVLFLAILVTLYFFYGKKENFDNLSILNAIKKDITDDFKEDNAEDPQEGDRSIEAEYLKNKVKFYKGREIESYGSGKILLNPKFIPGFQLHKTRVEVPVVEPKKSIGVSMPVNNVHNNKKVYNIRNENVKPIIGQEPHKAHVDVPVVEAKKPLAIISS